MLSLKNKVSNIKKPMYTQQSSENELIDGCKNQNQLAQKYLYKRFYSTMLNSCMRYTNNRQDAVEILNNGFLKVFNSIGGFEGKGSLEGWIRKIIINTALDFTRSQRKYKEAMDFESTKENSISPEVIDRLTGEDILSVMQRIPISSRQVFSLYMIDGYTHKEIGSMLEISEGTSKWHLSRAKELFKKFAEKLFILV